MEDDKTTKNEIQEVQETQEIETSAKAPEVETIPAPEPTKKKKFPVLAIVLVLAMIGSAVGVFYLVSSMQGKKEPTVIVDELPQEEEKYLETSTEKLFTKDTMPRIDASLATQPLTDAFIENFTGSTTKDLGIEYTNTHPGYVKLINNETDLIVVTEPSEEELKLAKEKNVELEVTKAVNEGFIFFVNKNNPVNEISFDNLVKIYTGEITNWKDLGGNDAEIIAYQRPENSGSQTGLYNLVLKGKKVKVPTIKENVELSMEGIVSYVASYENGANAIGYGFHYYVNTMQNNSDIKYITVDGVAPNYNTIQDESYPIQSAYYIVTRKGEKNKKVAELKNAMLSRRGQFVASKAGYVPANK